MKRYLSGIQPSGVLHLGNYFGAIKQHIELQDKGECFFFIANYHALTTLHNAEELYDNTIKAAATYLALGLDPQKVTIYKQTGVNRVCELAWVLATVSGMGLLERGHSYKDKTARGITPSVGLFTYPILMAADILAVQADIVPVGKDQIQHIEMTRDIAQHFNNTYKPTLKLPEAQTTAAGNVPGTKYDGDTQPPTTSKMSKSKGNIIEIFARGKALKKQVMGIETHSTPLANPLDPDNCLVFKLYSLFATEEEIADLKDKYLAGGFGYGNAKKALLQKIEDTFGQYRESYDYYIEHPIEVEDILLYGADRANRVIEETLAAVNQACGLLRQ